MGQEEMQEKQLVIVYIDKTIHEAASRSGKTIDRFIHDIISNAVKDITGKCPYTPTEIKPIEHGGYKSQQVIFDEFEDYRKEAAESM